MSFGKNKEDENEKNKPDPINPYITHPCTFRL